MQRDDISLGELIVLQHDTSSDSTPISIVVHDPTTSEDDPGKTVLSLDRREAAVIAFLLAGAGGGIIFPRQLVAVEFREDRHGNDAELIVSDQLSGEEVKRLPVRSQETAEILYAIIGL